MYAQQRAKAVAKQRSVLVVRFNNYRKCGALPKLRANVVFVCAECPRQVLLAEVADGCAKFPIDRQHQGFNRTLARDLSEEHLILHLKLSVFKVICEKADWFLGFVVGQKNGAASSKHPCGGFL